MAEPVDWPALMRLGLGALRLPAETFWAMSPNEFCRALEGAGLKPFGALPGLDRRALDALMVTFPDGAGGSPRPEPSPQGKGAVPAD